jgi:hypothetical protein
VPEGHHSECRQDGGTHDSDESNSGRWRGRGRAAFATHRVGTRDGRRQRLLEDRNHGPHHRRGLRGHAVRHKTTKDRDRDESGQGELEARAHEVQATDLS